MVPKAMLFHSLELNESRNVTDTVASVKQSVASLSVRLRAWLLRPSRLWTRITGEAFTRLQVLACYAGALLFLVILGLVGSMEGGAL